MSLAPSPGDGRRAPGGGRAGGRGDGGLEGHAEEGGRDVWGQERLPLQPHEGQRGQPPGRRESPFHLNLLSLIIHGHVFCSFCGPNLFIAVFNNH